MTPSTAISQPRLDGHQSQQAFQAILQSLAEPGTIRRVPDAFADGVPAVSVLVLALADVEVAITVDDDRTDPLGQVLAHTTGARSVPTAEADLVTLTTPDPAVVARCRRGTALAPELGARLAVRVDALIPEPVDGDLVLGLSGPGVPGSRRLGIAGLPAAFVTAVVDANTAFPAGIDTWLITDAGHITALSRSTRITIEESRGPSGPLRQRSNMSGTHRGSATIDLPGRS